jgi:acyl carrier protein
MTPTAGAIADQFPFIALEGCDGVGKSSIRNLLRDGLESAGMPCMMVGQHSWLDLPSARIINDIRDQVRSHPEDSLMRAYLVDKSLHAHRTIGPALDRRAVIADRYYLSDAVYQEVLYGVPAEHTLQAHRDNATLRPHVVVYVWAPVELAYERIQRRSKAARHYERPAEMRRIFDVYERVLSSGSSLIGAEVVQFENVTPDWRARVGRELVPAVLAAAHRAGLSADRGGREAVRRRLETAAAQVAGTPLHLRDHQRLADIELDSLDIIDVIVLIEDELNITIRADDLRDVEDVGELIDVVTAKCGQVTR